LTLQQFMRIVSILQSSDSEVDHLLFLILCCGARKCEILKLASFEDSSYDDERGNWILQTGFAKKRSTTHRDYVRKPLLLIPYERFRTRLEYVREWFDPKDSHFVEARVKELIPRVVELGYRAGTHIFRALYANAAYSLRGKPNESLSSFIRDVLGHEGLDASLHYTFVRID